MIANNFRGLFIKYMAERAQHFIMIAAIVLTVHFIVCLFFSNGSIFRYEVIAIYFGALVSMIGAASFSRNQQYLLPFHFQTANNSQCTTSGSLFGILKLQIRNI